MHDGRSWPADKVERRNIETLIPYARNSRTHSDEQITQIASSIKEWGFTNPILVDAHNEIIAGHGRLLAAKKLNLKDGIKSPEIDISKFQKTKIGDDTLYEIER